MKAVENPDYLRALADGVGEFRQALSEFLELHVVNEGFVRGIAPAVLPGETPTPSGCHSCARG